MGGQLLVEDQVGLNLSLAVFVQNGFAVFVHNLAGSKLNCDLYRRILQRNGEAMHQRFVTQWIPLEETYFDKLAIRDTCDFVIVNE